MGPKKQFVSCDGGLKIAVRDARYPKSHQYFSTSYT
jgi:hypothetical protein